MGDGIDGLAEFLREYDLSLTIALLQHLRLVGLSLLIGTSIGVPLGIIAWRSRRSEGSIFAVANVLQTIPSIALFGMMIPILALIDKGIGAVPAVIALILYAQLPIIRNTHTALRSVPDATLDAARGMGLTEREILTRVALPLAAPGIISGIRLAAVLLIGVASIAAYIGAGGLGLFVVRGLSSAWNTMILAGAIGIVLLTIIVELLLRLLERAMRPKGIRP